MKLLAPIAAIIAAASAGRIYSAPTVENYANAAEVYQSALEHQQRGLYSSQSEGHAGYEVANHRPEGEKTAKILGYHNENDGHHYQYAYETENGIKVEEAGETHDKGTAAHGAFSYKGDDGQVYSVSYTADENGFRPTGAHLPTPPPVPEEILKSLEQNAKDEAAGIFDDGNYHGTQEGHQDHQQIQGGHQSTGYHSSDHSGVDLAFHAHAPSVHSGERLLQQAPSAYGSSLGHQGSSGHSGANIAYFTPSGHGDANLGYQASSGHGTNLGYQVSSGHGANLGYQASSGHGANLGYQASSGQEANLGYHTSSGHGANLGYQVSSGHGASLGSQVSSGYGSNFGHQTSFGHEAALGHQASAGHGLNLQSGFQVSSGHSVANMGYSVPSGYSTQTAHTGNSGHVGMGYLPPTGHGGAESGYHGYQ